MNWISVKDKLPSEDEWILVGTTQYKMVTPAVCMDGKFFNPDLNYFEIQDITHWMPFPPPPSE